MRTLIILLCLSVGLIAEEMTEPTQSTTSAEITQDPNAVVPIAADTALDEGWMIQEGEGAPVSLKAALGETNTVLVVYRGSWCPYCTRHLAALGKVSAQLEEQGWSIVGLSPDSPETIASYKEKSESPHRLLSDGDGSVVRALGLGFIVDNSTQKKLKKYGIDLTKASGHDHNQLPVPAVLLIDKTGVVRYVHYNPDYSKRLKEKVLLEEIAKIE